MHSKMPSFAPFTYRRDHSKVVEPGRIPNFLDNELVESSTTAWIDVCDPATDNLLARVPESTPKELEAAVESAKRAFPKWKRTSIIARQQCLFRLVALIRENWDDLAYAITLEQGKTFADARGDVYRGLQVAEVCNRKLNADDHGHTDGIPDCMWYNNSNHWSSPRSCQRYGNPSIS